MQIQRQAALKGSACWDRKVHQQRIQLEVGVESEASQEGEVEFEHHVKWSNFSMFILISLQFA